MLNELGMMLINKPNPTTPKGISRISPKTILFVYKQTENLYHNDYSSLF